MCAICFAGFVENNILWRMHIICAVPLFSLFNHAVEQEVRIWNIDHIAHRHKRTCTCSRAYNPQSFRGCVFFTFRNQGEFCYCIPPESVQVCVFLLLQFKCHPHDWRRFQNMVWRHCPEDHMMGHQPIPKLDMSGYIHSAKLTQMSTRRW